VDSILAPDHRITRADAKMLAGLSDPERGGKAWMEQLTPQHRQAIVGKIIASINELKAADRTDMKILSRLTMVLSRLDELDFKREQAESGAMHPHITNNTQINISTQPVPRALQNKEGRDALAKLAELAFDGDAAEPSEG
jgi:hypothetical protein